MEIRIARDRKEWNAIVDQNPYSVLHHKYELCTRSKNALPLIIREGDNYFLFPLCIRTLFRSFRLATSPFHYHASLLPDVGAIDLVPKVLNKVAEFLQDTQVDYLSTCAPTFLSQRYSALLNSWFMERGASVQMLYYQMIQTKDTTFEEIWRRHFRKRNREEIRKAEREGISAIKIDTVDGLYEWWDDIHECNVSALMRQGRWGAYPESYKEVYLSELVSTKKLLKEHFNVYGTIYRGRLIAYATIQEYNHLMALTNVASRTEFLRKHPNDVLFAHLVREACGRGFWWFEYGFDRVKRGEKIPSLYSGLQMFRHKFGFKDVPVPVYRLGLTRSGRVIQHLYSNRERLITQSAYIPKLVRGLFEKLYASRRRKLSVFSHD